MSNTNTPSPRPNSSSATDHPPTPPTKEPEYQTAKGCLLMTLALVVLAIITIVVIALSQYL